jgi:LemA protein
MVWILGAALLIALGWAVGVFNSLVRLKNRALGSWSDIDVQLKRRHDLVANLVETVKGYVAHERETLERVVRARTEAESARTAGRPGEAGAAENRLTGDMRQLFALAEAYPDLKASDRFLDLQKALVEIEDDLQNARRYYNAVVRDLNSRIQSFPHVLIARPLGFGEREYFTLDDPAEGRAPHIDLGGSPS